MKDRPLRSRRRRRGGVTLIEALAALALLAAVAPVLARAWAVTLDSAARSRAQIVAATLAENRLAEIIAAGDYSKVEDSGDFGQDYEGFRWKSAVYDWPEDSRLQQLDVTVEWTRKNLTHETTVSTVVTATGE